MDFSELNLNEQILSALGEEGYSEPTPIQAEAIPVVLEGRDLLGCAQTGTGKTAAFAIPILQRLAERPAGAEKRKISALVITPTRELALQIHESFTAYGRHLKLRCAVVFGGVSQKPQEDALAKGVDILIATPGRLWDLMGQKLVDISKIDVLVLDEADRMLDMGFIHDVRRIVKKTPDSRQTLMFSATMPPDIAELANEMLKEPHRIDIAPAGSTVDTIRQFVYFVDREHKKDLLEYILEKSPVASVLVFTRTKHGADRLQRLLSKDGIKTTSIHGDKSQGSRQAALKNFKDHRVRVLVATDIAARGIDIYELPLVINYDLPQEAETYVHRIGRTGRAGMPGVAISFCSYEEKLLLSDVEWLTGDLLCELTDNPYPMRNITPEKKDFVPSTYKSIGKKPRRGSRRR